MADAVVNVFDPSGKYGTLEESELEAALAQGYTLATDDQQRFEKLKEVSDGPVGATAALTTSALNTASFGATDYLLEKFLPEQKEIVDAAREVNPIASGVGTAGGFVVGATGTLAKAAVKGGQKVAGQVAARGGGTALQAAAKYGTEGLIASSPLAAAQVLAGEPDEAAETLLYGGLTSAGLGASFKVAAGKTAPLRAILSKKAAGVEQAATEFIDRSATFASAKAAGFSKGMIAKAGLERTKELADFAQEKGLVKLFSKTEDTYQIVEHLRKEEGKTIGKILRSVDSNKKGLVDGQSLLQAIRSKVEVPQGQLLTPERNAFKRAFSDVFDAVTEEVKVGKTITRQFKSDVRLADIQKLKTSLGDYAYRDWSAVRPARQLVSQMERIVDDTIEDALERASGLFPSSAAAWRQAKSDYRNYNDLLKPFKNQFAIEVGNKLIGPSDMAFGIIGATQGGAKGALLGWVFNEARQRYAAKGAATVLNGINDSLKNRNTTITNKLAGYFAKAPKVPSGTRAATVGAVQSFFSGKEDENTQILELGKRLDSYANNPQELADSLSDVTDDAMQADERVGVQMQTQAARAIEHLREHIPRPTAAQSPFEKPRFNPSTRQVASFKNRLQAALEPYSVIDDFSKGRVSRESIDTLKIVHPYFHSQLAQEIISLAAERKRDLSYNERLRLSTLLGTPIDPTRSPEKVNLFQSLYGQETQTEKVGSGKDIDIAQKSLTTAQRISAR